LFKCGFNKAQNITQKFLVFCFAAYIIFLPISVKGQTNFYQKPLSSKDIVSGWQYRWGDSPVNKVGKFEWAVEGQDKLSWHNFTVPGKPQNNANRKNV
jgi:hypothetical protein